MKDKRTSNNNSELFIIKQITSTDNDNKKNNQCKNPL